MKIHQHKSALLATLGAALLISSAPGQTITGVTIEDVTSELTGGFSRLAVHTVDGSGFEPNGVGTHSVAPDDEMWLSNGTFTAPNDPLPAVITFDLEGNYDLNSLTVWNYNEANLSNRGAQDVEILVSDREGGTFTSLGNFVFDQAPANDTTDFGQVIDLSSFADADSTRLIRFNITSNYGDTNDFAGLSEVRFDGASVVGPLIITDLIPDEVSSVALDANLVATFSKDIALTGTGSITLTDLDDGTGTVVITLPDGGVSASGAELTIDPALDLEVANYEVTIDGSAVESTEVTPEAFIGTSAGQWTFSTFSLVEGVAVKEVAGDGVIDDEILPTDTLDGQIGTSWRTPGGNGDAFSSIVSPTVVVPETGPVTLSFTHRYNYEFDYDGGAVFVSINGTEPTYVGPAAFTQNGYDNDVVNTIWPDANGAADNTGRSEAEVFNGQSANFGLPTYVVSVADLGTLNDGDTVSVEFRSGWDANTFPAGVNWEIATVTLTDTTDAAFLDADFADAGTEGFTVVNDLDNAGFAGGWAYPSVQHVFEIDADTPENDRYVPSSPGAVIDLNGADIAVELAAGTLEAGDEFTLFDLSGGTTLSGSIGNLTLPPGLWDASTLAIDGRLILLLPEATGGATAGADFEVDARTDTDGDAFWEELIGTVPYEFYLDTANGVAQMATGSSTQMRHAYDFPGGFSGDAAPNDAEAGYGGGKLVGTGSSGECISFNNVGWHGNDATLEFWIKPDNLTPTTTNGQIIFEDGGGSGFGLFLNANEIYTSQDNGNAGDGQIYYNLDTDPQGLLIDTATTEFTQVVLTRLGSTGAVEMFINGVSVGTATANNGGGWSGGDGFGLGARGEANTGGQGNGDDGTESFDGQIGLFRIYNQQILTPAEVAANFNAIADADTTAPTYLSLSPANLSTEVFFENSLVATFTEGIALTGTGSVTIRNLDTMSDTVIPVTDPQVTVNENELTIDPTSPLDYDTNYAVLISADAIVDEAPIPNAFAGISDETRWTFTTAPQDLAPPAITSLSPVDNATDVMALDALVATFDETLVIGSGTITLKNLTDETELVIDITDDTQVSLAGNVLTITPVSTLMSKTDYAVQIAAGIASDISGNAFAGILDDVTWNFTTGTYPNVLFADTFNRPNSTDLNASPAGKSGLFGTSNWGSGNLQSLIDINGNTMRINNNDSDGNDGSWAWVEQNFAGLGEFTVTLDIASQSSGGDGRFTGFRVGQSLADISGETDASIGGNAADVQVYLDNIGTTKGIRVFEGSDDLGYVVTSGGIGELSATFTCDNTNAGTTLNYEIFLNGVSQYTGSTAWSGTDENYISVQSNSTNDTRFDSFIVTGSFAGPGDYETWAALYPAADLTDPGADFDGDGLSNDEERLFGLDPTDPASSNPITVGLDAGAGTFSFTRRDPALTGKFTHIETSTDLQMWSKDAGTALVVTGPDANGVETVDVTLSGDLLTGPRLFVRVVLDDGIVLAESFDDGPDLPLGWSSDGPVAGTDWEVGNPTGGYATGPVDGANSPDNCVGTNIGTNGGQYTDNTNVTLSSPVVGVPDGQGVTLSFAQFVDTDLSADVGAVRIVDTDNANAVLGEITNLEGDGTGASWSSDSITLDSATAGGKNIQIQFQFVSDASTSYGGFYIDDVTLSLN